MVHLSIGLAIGLVAVHSGAQSSAPAGNSTSLRGPLCHQMIAGAAVTMSNASTDVNSSTSADTAPIQARQPGTQIAVASSMVNPVTGEASATVSREKKADTLADDPAQLAKDLSTLAGPSAGPDVGPISIDPAFR